MFVFVTSKPYFYDKLKYEYTIFFNNQKFKNVITALDIGDTIFLNEIIFLNGMRFIRLKLIKAKRKLRKRQVLKVLIFRKTTSTKEWCIYSLSKTIKW